MGVVTVMTMFAFEGVGVATAMPAVARALGGLESYAWAFNGYLVSSLVAMVVAGEWCDREGPRRPLLAAVTLFGLGALVAGSAWSMPVLVAGRVVMGLGGGLGIVSVYVVIARAFPEDLRARAFALLSAAWVLPAVVGPAVAGLLTDYVSWRAVFWLVIPFVVPPALILAPRLARLGGALGEQVRRPGRVRVALVAAVGLALLQEGGTRLGLPGLALAVLGLAVLVPAVRLLLPSGALRFAPGLPTVVMIRGVLAGAFFAGETFIPLALQSVKGASTAQSGFTLTVGAVAWAVGSQVQGRLYGRVPRVLLVQAGGALVTLCLVTLPVALLPSVTFWVAGVSWFAGAAGMGLCFGAIATLTLELSQPQDQGINTASLQVCDSVGSVLLIGVAGAMYGAALSAGAADARTYTTIWWSMAVVALLGTLVAARIGRPPGTLGGPAL